MRMDTTHTANLMIHKRLRATEGSALGHDGAGCRASIQPTRSACQILRSASTYPQGKRGAALRGCCQTTRPPREALSSWGRRRAELAGTNHVGADRRILPAEPWEGIWALRILPTARLPGSFGRAQTIAYLRVMGALLRMAGVCARLGNTRQEINRSGDFSTDAGRRRRVADEQSLQTPHTAESAKADFATLQREFIRSPGGTRRTPA
jgi:hypothetical protein